MLLTNKSLVPQLVPSPLGINIVLLHCSWFRKRNFGFVFATKRNQPFQRDVNECNAVYVCSETLAVVCIIGVLRFIWHIYRPDGRMMGKWLGWCVVAVAGTAHIVVVVDPNIFCQYENWANVPAGNCVQASNTNIVYSCVCHLLLCWCVDVCLCLECICISYLWIVNRTTCGALWLHFVVSGSDAWYGESRPVAG